MVWLFKIQKSESLFPLNVANKKTHLKTNNIWWNFPISVQKLYYDTFIVIYNWTTILKERRWELRGKAFAFFDSFKGNKKQNETVLIQFCFLLPTRGFFNFIKLVQYDWRSVVLLELSKVFYLIFRICKFEKCCSRFIMSKSICSLFPIVIQLRCVSGKSGRAVHTILKLSYQFK